MSSARRPRVVRASSARRPPVVRTRLQFPDYFKLNSRGQLCYVSSLNPSTNTTFTPLQRLDVCIYDQAKTTWRSLRNSQDRKVELELRIAYNQRLLDTDHFPEWAVKFNPPLSLLSTTRAIESTVSFRYEQAKQSIAMLRDLMKEESAKLDSDIEAGMAALECHYHQEVAREFKLQEAIDALSILVKRKRETEEAELSRRYNAIHVAPLASLWMNLPDGITTSRSSKTHPTSCQ